MTRSDEVHRRLSVHTTVISTTKKGLRTVSEMIVSSFSVRCPREHMLETVVAG